MTGVRNSVPRDLVPGFAQFVKGARERRNWSQRQLARMANVSAMCVCDLEAERRSPSLRVASQIASALELDCKLAEPAGGVRATEPLAEPAPPVKDRRRHVVRRGSGKPKLKMKA